MHELYIGTKIWYANISLNLELNNHVKLKHSLWLICLEISYFESADITKHAIIILKMKDFYNLNKIGAEIFRSFPANMC